MLASAMPYKEGENEVNVGTTDPILMLYLLSFDWQDPMFFAHCFL